jgi:peptide-methionine (S)-S-oxide reductase
MCPLSSRLSLAACALLLASAGAADTAGGKSNAFATFAGGCFWCMEHPFDGVAGVVATTSGYTGGRTAHPTYKEVSAGGTGHTEALQVTYDPATVSYGRLLEVYWRNIDPFDGTGQFCDRGDSYRPAIFFHTADQRRAAERSKADVERRLGRPVAVPIQPAAEFYPAEDYHQNYYQKNPLRYQYYRYRCGRDQRLEQVWGKAGH